VAQWLTEGRSAHRLNSSKKYGALYFYLMAVQWATTALDLTIFGRPFVKRFALCYRIVVYPVCLSATLVYCSQMVGWIKMKLGMEVGLYSGHIVLDGDSAPHSKKGTQPPIFGPCLLWPNGWMD